jgi:protein required for attachment to host cells
MVFGDTKPLASIERSDRPGRTFDSKGQGRHSLEPRSNTKLQYQTQFANNVSKTLLSQFQSKSFDQLVVVAPPTFMGILRQSLPNHLKNVLYGELTMDLVHEPIEKIGVHLEDILPV